MEHALSGVKILDFGHYIAGPYAAMLLAEQGAEVIKVERPDGDPCRRKLGFIVWNRSKKDITLDLKKAEGQRIAQELAKKSDVIIENFSPGVADRLGVGYDTISQLNPRIVYCSISGFGQSGPYRDVPGWEPIVSSLATLYTEQGYITHPLYMVLPLASTYGAFMAAFSVATALYAREITEKGQRIDISLFGSMLAAQSIWVLNFKGRERMPWGPQGLLPLYRLYQGSDGKWFFLGLGTFTFFTKFAVLMEREEWLADPLFEGAPFLIMPPRNARVIAMLKDIFSTKPRDEWVELFSSADLPCTAIRPIEEFLNDPQILANEMVVEVEEPRLGMVREMGVPVKFLLTPGKVKGPSPVLGQHSQEILGDLGYSEQEITKFRDEHII